jgi:hypothetical protein
MNTKKFWVIVLALAMCLLNLPDAMAQSKKKSSKKKPTKKELAKKKEEEPRFGEKLWYGGGVNLGFSGFNGTSAFGFGVSPMVGYKIVKNLSVGPRVSFLYTSLKNPGYKALNLLDTEAGAFVRFHIFRGFFIQGEFSNQWSQEPFTADPITRTISKVKYQRFNQYGGVGYNFGRGEGGAGTEIALMYNFAIANDLNSYENPLGYRFGFTWKF